MSMAGGDITIEILKDIRDAARDTNKRLDGMSQHLGGVTDRLDMVETTLLDMAEQNRFMVRHLRTISEREIRLEPRVSALESRVDKLESK
jgi:small-conductance mechanosensitive channel